MNKWFIRGAIITAIMILFLVIAGSEFISYQEPDYGEKIQLDGFRDHVDIYYDQYAIPHIYASNQADAYMALGYAHAKDRLWQMDILRRIAPGRLAEVFGNTAIKNDRFFRTIGLAHQSKKEAEIFMKEAAPELKEIVLGYIDGINHFIAKGSSSLEHKILGIEMAPYTLEDVYNVIGYMAFSFTLSHRTEPIVDFIRYTYGQEYLEALDIHVAPGSETINSVSMPDYSPISLHIDQLIKELPVPELIGSNSWVISGNKTSSGSVILANDPHIGYSQPSVWYEAHIEIPGLSLYGNYLAGFPLAQIGHTRHHAIGLTMFENDDLDYYRERVNPDNPDQYWSEGRWKDFQSRREDILVEDGENVNFTVRETDHGPIISDVVSHLSSDDPVSMWWVYQKFPLKLLEGSYLIMTSNSIEGVQEGVSLIHAPGLNVMYGDIEGNIAWWAAAKLPKRPVHVNSKTILNGASGDDDVSAFHDFEDNPQAINPPGGFVYSANNQSISSDGTRHPGYYLPEDRARRINHLLSENDDWTIEEVKSMMLDVTSDNTTEIIASILVDLNVSEFSPEIQGMINVLSKWDGTYGTDQIASTIYVKTVYHILHSMIEDELGERWETFNGTHLMKRSIQPMIANLNSPWWDNVLTQKQESRIEIIHEAISLTYKELNEQLGSDMSNWKWGLVHTLEHPHAFDANPTIKSYFNVGPFPVPGGTEVINNFQFTTTDDGTYEVKAGPSSRRAIQLSDLNNQSWGILPTGQSGNVFSPHYEDQAQMFVQGKFRKQLMSKEEIKNSQRYHTAIRPN